MRIMIAVTMFAAILTACQPIVPEPQAPNLPPTSEPTPTPSPTSEPEKTTVQTPEPYDSDPLWPDMRYTEPLKIEEFEMTWAISAAQADLRELLGTEFEADVEDELGGTGLTLFYYMLLLQAQANCFEDGQLLTDLIDQQASRVGPRLVAEAEAEDYANPPFTRHIILTVLLFSWEEGLDYFCMDKACLADVEATTHCGEWLDRNLDCIVGESPGECLQ